MASPTDRGYAVISHNDDGTVDVDICTAIENGRPVGIYARHVRAPRLNVDPGVRMIRTGSVRYTTSVVEVSKGGGGVLVRARARSLPA